MSITSGQSADPGCAMARESLSARLDGEQEPVPRARVDAHLAHCADCAQWWSAVSASLDALRRTASIPVLKPTSSGEAPSRWAGLVALLRPTRPADRTVELPEGAKFGRKTRHLRLELPQGQESAQSQERAR